jgi:GTPase SAR1 family protein
MATRNRVKSGLLERARKAAALPQGAIKVALVGTTGAGKTTLAAQVRNPLFIQLERQGVVAIQHANPEALIVTGDMFEGEGEESKTLKSGNGGKMLTSEFARLWSEIKTAPTKVDENNVCYKEIGGERVYTIVIDSATSFVQMATKRITGEPEGGMSLEELADGKYRMRIDSWGTLRTIFDNLCSDIAALPISVILIMHEKEVMDESTGKRSLLPLTCTESQSRSFGKEFTAIGRVSCEEVYDRKTKASSRVRKVSFEPTSRTGVDWVKPIPGGPTEIQLDGDGLAEFSNLFKSQQ